MYTRQSFQTHVKPVAARQGEPSRLPLDGMDARADAPKGMGGLRRLQDPAHFEKAFLSTTRPACEKGTLLR